MERVSQKQMLARGLIDTHKHKIKKNRFPQLQVNMKGQASVIIKAWDITEFSKYKMKHAKKQSS